jgi:acyl-CoA reductase-like NAD-dependent aldehyde dehydrogenase
MTLKTDLYIDGKWVKGSGTVPVYDPSDGSVIAEIVMLQLMQLIEHFQIGQKALQDIELRFCAKHLKLWLQKLIN